METPALFALASQRTRWLAERQAVVAENVANANTPGFQSKEIEPFEAVLQGERFGLAATRPGHLTVADRARAASVATSADADATHSGNTVSLEQEMMKLGEIRRHHALTTGILKSFHKFLLMGARG